MRDKELSIVDSRLHQSKKHLISSQQMLDQKKLALSFLSDEISMHDKLLKNGYTSKLKVLELKRSEVLLASDIISVQSELNDLSSSIDELHKQKQAMNERNNSDIEGQISDVRTRLISLSSDVETAKDAQYRTIIKSPSNGVVLGLKVNTAGEVINPGQTLMQIVPDHDELVIESLINPNDIDIVTKGQQALIRLSAYNYRTTPILHGKVIYLDADRMQMKEGTKSESGFRIKIKVNQKELNDNPEIKLYPGMPAEVYVILHKKRPLDYLLKPFTISLLHAFREN